MMRPEYDDGRPAVNGPASSVIVGDGDKSNDTRCERCSRPIRAARSVERGLGPVCCRAAVAV